VAVTNDQLTISLIIDGQGAIKGIQDATGAIVKLKKETDDFNSVGSDASGVLSKLGFSVVAVNQALELGAKAWSATVGLVEKAIDRFAEADAQQAKLSNTLKLGGVYNKQLMDSYKEFAAVIQKKNAVDDDQILGLAAIGVATGRTQKEVEKLIQASIDLAAFTGDDVKGSFEQLLRAEEGLIGRNLKLVPGIAAVTDEQAKQGKVTDLVSQRLAHQGELAAKTFAGMRKSAELSFGDLEETIGQTFVELFSLGEKQASKQRLFVYLQKEIEEIRPKLFEIRDAIVGFAKKVSDAFSKVDFSALFNSLKVILVILSGPIVLALGAVAAAFALIGVAIVSVVASAITLLGTIDAVAKTVINFFKYTLAGASLVKEKFQAMFSTEDNSKALDEASKKFDELSNKPILDPGFLKTLNEQVTNFANGFSSVAPEIQKSSDATESLSDNVNQVGKGFERIHIMSDQTKKEFEELVSKAKDFQKAGQGENLLPMQKVEFETNQLREQLKLLTDKLQKEHQLEGVLAAQNKQKLSQIALQIKQGELAKQAAVSRDYAKTANENAQKINDATSQIGMTERDRIKFENEQTLKDIAKRRNELGFGATGEAVGALSKEREAAQASGAKKLAFGPTELTDSIQKGGQFLTQDISNAFMGPMNAAQQIVDSAQQLVDALPKLLESITNLVNSITDLPMRIAADVANLVKGIIRLVSDFIPNLVKAIPQILQSIIQGLLINLPNAFLRLADKLPDLIINGLIEKLPGFIEKFVAGFITSSPKIGLALVEFFVIGMPKITLALIRAIPSIAKAVVNGLLEAFREIGSMLKDILTGSFSGLGGDIGESLSKGVAAITAGVSGVSDQLFKVMDLGAGNKADTVGKDVKSLIDDSLSKTKNIFAQLWDGIKKAFQWVWDKIFKPIFDGLKAAWEFISDKIFGPMVELLKSAWLGIEEAFNSAINAFRSLWNFVKTLFDKPIAAFRSLFIDVKAMFDGVISGFISAFSEIKNLGDVFTGFGNNIVTGFTSGFSSIGGTITAVFNSAFDSSIKYLSGIIGNLNPANLLEKMFKDTGGEGGTVEKWLGINIPMLTFSQGGMVPGLATYDGDHSSNDTVPAMLSPGEAVLPRRVTKNKSYQKLIAAMMAGTPIEHHFGGIDSVGSAISGAVSSAGNWISGAGSAASNALGNIGNETWASAREGMGALGVSTEQGFNALQDVYKKIYETTSNGWGYFTQYIEVLGKDAMAAWDFLNSIGAHIDWLKFIKDPKGEATEAFKSVGSNYLAKELPKYAQALVAPNKFADGGLVGGMGNTDSISAMLTPGEFVINKNAVNNLGLPALNILNRGMLPNQSGATVHEGDVNIQLSITTEQPIDESFVRNKLMPTIKNELRRASLDGKRVLSPAGC
jgi:hypothetical protein